MDQLRPRKQVGLQKTLSTVLFCLAEGTGLLIKSMIRSVAHTYMVKKISSIAFKVASLKEMEYCVLSPYFNWEFSWPVTFTFVQHYPIIYQHSGFLAIGV